MVKQLELSQFLFHWIVDYQCNFISQFHITSIIMFHFSYSLVPAHGVILFCFERHELDSFTPGVLFRSPAALFTTYSAVSYHVELWRPPPTLPWVLITRRSYHFLTVFCSHSISGAMDRTRCRLCYFCAICPLGIDRDATPPAYVLW